MHERHDPGALATGRRDALHRAAPDVAGDEDPGHGGRVGLRRTPALPRLPRGVGAGEDEAEVVAGHLARAASAVRLGAEQEVEPGGLDPLVRAGVDVVQGEPLEAALAAAVGDDGARPDRDARVALDLADEVARHRRGEALATHEDRHAPGEAREVHGRLAGAVAATDDVTSLRFTSREVLAAAP